MTQPRKEQIKNLKTKYTRYSSTNSVVLGGGGLVSQTIKNTIPGGNYDLFLAYTRTKTVGGAENDCPAMIYGGYGPFNLSNGNSFTITLSGVNNQLPITITFTSSHIITLGGLPVITTSTVVSVINSAVSAYGVTNRIAFNINGQLVIKSANTSGYSYGNSAFISLNDVSPGVLVLLGITNSNSITVNGITAPKRGIVTESPDGFGGIVQLKNPDFSQSEPINNYMVHNLNRSYTPSITPGRPAYAKIRAFPGAIVNGRNIKVDFYRFGTIQPQIITSRDIPSNFTALNVGETLNVNIVFNIIDSISFGISLSTITTVQQLVDVINNSYSNYTLSLTGIRSTCASVKSATPGPYYFNGIVDSFSVSFNGNTPISIYPSPGTYSATMLALFINTAISSSGQSLQGQAIVINNYVVIESKNTNGTQSSVEFIPGNRETMLNNLGIAPGLYKGSVIASLVGNDEILFKCPSTSSDAQITISSISSTMAKFGFSALSITVGSSQGEVGVPVPVVQALLPEVVEFSEEPDDYDTQVQSFDVNGHKSSLLSSDGIKNSGINELLDSFGKINSGLIPKILDSINVDRLRLGSGLISSLAQQLIPRSEVTHTPNLGPVLVWQGTPTDTGTLDITRVYLKNGRIILATNAYISSYSSGVITWTRDRSSDASVWEWDKSSFQVGTHLSAESATWVHTDWKFNIKTNSSGSSITNDDGTTYGNEILSLGSGLQSGGSDSLVPRISIPASSSTGRVLVSEHKYVNGVGVRCYCNSTSTNTSFEVTTNAIWNGTSYSKDVNDISSMSFSILADSISVNLRLSSNNSSWSSWDTTPLSTDSNGTVLLSADQRPEIPRLSVIRTVSRMLVFQSVGNMPFISPIRTYMDESYNRGPAAILITVNARWDQPSVRWIQDVIYDKSFALVINNSSVYLLSKPSGSTPWVDDLTGWENYDQFDLSSSASSVLWMRDGVVAFSNAGTNSNPNNNTAITLNALYAKSMVKCWGVGDYVDSGPTILDGYNFSSIGVNGSFWDNFYATWLSTGSRYDLAVISNVYNFDFAISATQPCVFKCVSMPNNRFISAFYDFNGNLVPTSTACRAAFMVLGETL